MGSPRLQQDHRAISVQLARVTRGQSRLLAVPGPGWSAALAARIGRIPKLIVRVRFSSPALIVKAQVRALIPGRGPLPFGARGSSLPLTGHGLPSRTGCLAGVGSRLSQSPLAMPALLYRCLSA